MRMWRFARLGSLGVVIACSSTPSATIDVVTGEEADALTRAPAPATLIVESVDASGKSKEIARTSLPAAADLSLGDVSSTDVGAIRVTGVDAAGNTLVRGETLLFQFGALEAGSLSVFVQRTGELARVPASPGVSLDSPVADTVLGRYIIAASGTSSILYDLLSNESLTAPAFSRPARSMATYNSVLLVVDEQGATTFDLSTSYTGDLQTPSGGTFAEVAGGATVNAPDGSSYIVGGTRVGGDPTARVLRLTKDGIVTFASLATPRLGACATWIEGRGLVVVGGSATEAGVEVLAATATQGTSLPFPSDASTGCGAAALDGSHVVVAGGGSDARTLDLGCSVDCKPTPWPGSIPLGHAQVVTLAADAALVVGDDATGASRVFRAAAAGAREIPLRVPRRNARLVPLPNGAAAVVGGAPAIETYRD
jgi:hypothetical protein